MILGIVLIVVGIIMWLVGVNLDTEDWVGLFGVLILVVGLIILVGSFITAAEGSG